MRKILNFFQTHTTDYDALILTEEGALIAFATPSCTADVGKSKYLVNPSQPERLGFIEPDFSGEYEWWGGSNAFKGYYIRSDGTAMFADWNGDEDVRSTLHNFLTYKDD